MGDDNGIIDPPQPLKHGYDRHRTGRYSRLRDGAQMIPVLAAEKALLTPAKIRFRKAPAAPPERDDQAKAPAADHCPLPDSARPMR